MFLAHKPTASHSHLQSSLRADPAALSAISSDMSVEDGCTVRRAALSPTDPALWCVAIILGAATLWLMA
jgi:hypothetical protein